MINKKSLFLNDVFSGERGRCLNDGKVYVNYNIGILLYYLHWYEILIYFFFFQQSLSSELCYVGTAERRNSLFCESHGQHVRFAALEHFRLAKIRTCLQLKLLSMHKKEPIIFFSRKQNIYCIFSVVINYGLIWLQL